MKHQKGVFLCSLPLSLPLTHFLILNIRFNLSRTFPFLSHINIHTHLHTHTQTNSCSYTSVRSIEIDLKSRNDKWNERENVNVCKSDFLNTICRVQNYNKCGCSLEKPIYLHFCCCSFFIIWPTTTATTTTATTTVTTIVLDVLAFKDNRSENNDFSWSASSTFLHRQNHQ